MWGTLYQIPCREEHIFLIKVIIKLEILNKHKVGMTYFDPMMGSRYEGLDIRYSIEYYDEYAAIFQK